MTNEARLIQWWAERYENCAVNQVPKEIALEFPMCSHDRFCVEHHMKQTNLRFENGAIAGVSNGPYDDSWHWSPLDVYVDYGMLVIDPVISTDLDVDVSLSEVL